MRFYYDTIADAAVLRLRDEPIHSQRELENGVVISKGHSGKIALVEILDFSKHGNVLTLLEATHPTLPVTISHIRIMDEVYMKKHYPRFCEAQEKSGIRPWEANWKRAQATISQVGRDWL